MLLFHERPEAPTHDPPRRGAARLRRAASERGGLGGPVEAPHHLGCVR